MNGNLPKSTLFSVLNKLLVSEEQKQKAYIKCLNHWIKSAYHTIIYSWSDKGTYVSKEDPEC